MSATLGGPAMRVEEQVELVAGRSQEQLARMAGVDASRISRKAARVLVGDVAWVEALSGLQLLNLARAEHQVGAAVILMVESRQAPSGDPTKLAGDVVAQIADAADLQATWVQGRRSGGGGGGGAVVAGWLNLGVSSLAVTIGAAGTAGSAGGSGGDGGNTSALGLLAYGGKGGTVNAGGRGGITPYSGGGAGCSWAWAASGGDGDPPCTWIYSGAANAGYGGFGPSVTPQGGSAGASRSDYYGMGGNGGDPAGAGQAGSAGACRMKITTAPTFGSKAPPQNIVINGENIGTVTETDIGPHSRFHACLDMRSVARLGGPSVGNSTQLTLAQGHGATVEEAVSMALVASRRDAVAYINALNHLGALLEVA